MVDLNLQALLHREFALENDNPLDQQLDNEIDKLIEQNDYINFVNDPFNSPAIKKARLRAKIKEELELKPLSKYIESALNILVNDGKIYLSTDQYRDLMKAFSHAQEFLSKPREDLANYQTILQIKDTEMEAITKVAIEEFNQGKFDDCMAIFILLTTLRPDIFDYWYRAGIAAQKSALFDLAVKFYNTALELEDNMGAHLFLIDCYLSLKKVSEARSQLDKAKIISETKEMDEATRALLLKLESQIKVLL
ncbi:MAG TPA: hypothetical protein VGP47_06635 [Parachlamydiaceae bacterium]|nr:hypothetical protein [Parachlamydiaceae bacterium]